MKRDPLAWAALAAALVVTASAEYALARAAGFGEWTAGALPAALDIYAVRALRAGRDVAAAVAAMIATNAAAHLVAAGLLPVDWPLIVAVSAIAPLVVWRVHRLADHLDDGEPFTADTPPVRPDEVNTSTAPEVNSETPAEVELPATVPTAPTLVICGTRRVYTLAVPPADTGPEVNSEPPARLDTEQARRVIERCWADRVSIRETARRATRSPGYVAKVFTRLDGADAPSPEAGQLALAAEAV